MYFSSPCAIHNNNTTITSIHCNMKVQSFHTEIPMSVMSICTLSRFNALSFVIKIKQLCLLFKEKGGFKFACFAQKVKQTNKQKALKQYIIIIIINVKKKKYHSTLKIAIAIILNIPGTIPKIAKHFRAWEQ